jgi:glycyl-tRNA synthetase alpha subunit
MKSKIDKIKLSQMLRAGKSGKECAKYFNVTNGAISQAKKELNISVVKNLALETAHRVVDKHLNAVEQLQNINRKANGLLDMATAAKDHSTALKAMAEIRGQLNLELDIFKTLYDVQAIANFQQEVLDAIGEVSPTVREQIVTRLKEIRALRGSVSINRGGM